MNDTSLNPKALACREVFQTLSKINVNEHVQKKNNLSYLSWAWAYQTIMVEYPTFDYAILPDETHADGSMTVHCSVSVWEGEERVGKTMWLPVMNYANKGIPMNDVECVRCSACVVNCPTEVLSFGTLEKADTENTSYKESGIPFLEKGDWGRGL